MYGVFSGVLLIAMATFPTLILAEQIHLFAKKGDLEKVKAEILSGVPVDIPATSFTTVKGVTPLFVAAQSGQLEVAKFLLERGAEPNLYFWVEGNSGYAVASPLHAAAQRGFTEIAKVLIERGADPALYRYFSGAPLHVARVAGHLETSRFLIESGAPERIEKPPIEHKLSGADIRRGQKLAEGCVICHGEPAKNGGPGQNAGNLWGVVGRVSGQNPGPISSVWLRDAKVIWNPNSLNSFLAMPYAYIPGNLKFPGDIENEDDRVDLIAYLMTLRD